MSDFSDLQGLTLSAVRVINGDGRSGDSGDRIEFDESGTGRTFTLHHSQDCCESVVIESIVGDMDDLVGTPILLAEEAVSDTPPSDVSQQWPSESETWTFYKLRTIKGSVDIRWHGESNGYYSESVDFAETTKDTRNV